MSGKPMQVPDPRFSALLSLALREDVPDQEITKAFGSTTLEPKKLRVALDLLETTRPTVYAALQTRTRF